MWGGSLGDADDAGRGNGDLTGLVWLVFLMLELSVAFRLAEVWWATREGKRCGADFQS